MPMTFKQLQAEVGEWSRYNFPDSTPRDPYEGVIEELGELAHARLKGRQGIRGTAVEHEAAEKDALADLLIFMTNYCDRAGIDLENEVVAELTLSGIPIDDRSLATIHEALRHEEWHSDDNDAFDAVILSVLPFHSFRHCIGELATEVISYAVTRGFDLAAILEETWARVKLRDWRRDPVAAGQDA